MNKSLKNKPLKIKQSLKIKQTLKNKQLKRKEESLEKNDEIGDGSPPDENYIVLHMEDLLLIEFYLQLLGIIDENGKYITGHCHSKLMVGLATQLLQQGFFTKHDKERYSVTIITVIQYFMKRYTMPHPQRLYRDPEVCRKYAIAKLPVLREIRISRTSFLIKRPKLTHS